MPTARSARPLRARLPRGAAAAVEFAVVMPLVVMILLGILEVGRLAQIMQELHNAAREGARQASTSTATVADIKANVRRYIPNAEPGVTNVQGYDLEYQNVTDPGVTGPTQATQLDRFTVTVTLPYDNVRWTALGYFVESGTNLRATVNLMINPARGVAATPWSTARTPR